MVELSPVAVNYSEEFTALSDQKEILQRKMSGCDEFKAIIYQCFIAKIERRMEIVKEGLIYC